MDPNNQDLYLEPAVEINRDSLDPLAASNSEAVQIFICEPSGC